jgi:hypothetical protein
VVRRALTIPIAVLTMFLLASRAAAQAPDAFVVQGHVLNGTAGASPPTEGRVQVYAYSRERIDGPWDGQVDGSGAYRVDGVPRVEGAIYALGIDYGGASYAERVTQPGADAVAIRDLTVYESSTVDPGVQFEQVALLVSAVDTPGILSVTEIHRLENPTDRTFAPSATGPGGPAGLLVFPLPPNAFDLRADAGLDPARLVQIDRGFASLVPVPPGRTEIGFSYRFPYADSGLQLSRNVRYPISRFTVLVPDGGPSIASDRLMAGEAASIGGRSYRTLTGGPLAAGQGLQITLSGLPMPGGPLARVPPAAAAVAGVIVGVGALIATALFRRAGGDPTQSEDALVERLVALEAERSESRISEDDYERAWNAAIHQRQQS